MSVSRMLTSLVGAALCASAIAACATTRTREEACRTSGQFGLYCGKYTHAECYTDKEFLCEVCGCVPDDNGLQK